MATLAPKLPYTHPFAGGFPYRGSQRLPSDPDALTYLAAVAAADGAPVETAVAVAVDDFFRGTKADGIWDAIKASCILCGARTLAGALVPLVGTAPTNVADGFVAGDYTRGGATPGLKGDGTSYLDSGRANDADPQDSKHLAFFADVDSASGYMGSLVRSPAVIPTQLWTSDFDVVLGSVNNSTGTSRPYSGGFAATQRIDASTVEVRANGATTVGTGLTSLPGNDRSTFVFARNDVGTANSFSNSRIAFYSIGEALDLEALDARVTALVTAIGAAV